MRGLGRGEGVREGRGSEGGASEELQILGIRESNGDVLKGGRDCEQWEGGTVHEDTIELQLKVHN